MALLPKITALIFFFVSYRTTLKAPEVSVWSMKRTYGIGLGKRQKLGNLDGQIGHKKLYAIINAEPVLFCRYKMGRMLF
jgi:hypothetical protein